MSVFVSFWQAVYALILANPLAQGVGLLALIIGASAFLQKDDHKLKRNLTLYTLVIGVHFLLLGQWPAAVTAWLSSVRTYLSARTRNVWVMLIFLLIVWVLGLGKASTWIHYLPLFGATFGTWALFRETGLRMRLLMLAGTICWVIHNFAVGSIGGTLIEGSFLLINLRTMWSLLKEERLKAQAVT